MKTTEMKTFLETNFKCDNPDVIFPKYYLSGEKPAWRITVEEGYIPRSSDKGYSVCAWSCNDSGVIVKRCQAGYIKTLDELRVIIKLADLSIEI